MRQFVSAAAPNSKGLLEITGKDFHYLRKVLRMASGDMLSLSLPGGVLQDATVCKVDDGAKKITLQVCDPQAQNLSQAQDCAARSDGLQDKKSGGQNCPQAPNPAALRTRLALLQFIPKPQKMELIVRQATECGVAAIVPVIGEYTQAGFEKALQKSDRFEKIIREARQQSGSQVETKIYPPQKLSAALNLVEGAGFWQSEKRSHAQEAARNYGFANAPNAAAVAKVFLYERTDRTVPLSAALSGLANDSNFAAESYGVAANSSAALFGQEQDCSQAQDSAAASSGLAKSRAPAACVYAVGCEGGISPSETELLLARGFKGVHFNTNILRCETASLYAAAAIQSALDN